MSSAGGDLLEERFAKRAGLVDKSEGFEGFQLLRPTSGTNRYLVVTKWRTLGLPPEVDLLHA